MAVNDRLGPPVATALFTREWQDFLMREWTSNIGTPDGGLTYNHVSYDGPDYVQRIQNLDATDSNGIEWLNYDKSMHLRTNNGGMDWEGPWSFTGDGTITGDVTMTGDFGLTGDLNETGDATITGLLHVTGAVDFDSTLNVDGAATFNANVTLGDAVGDALLVKATSTFNEAVTMVKDLTVQGNTTLGNAVGDTISLIGTATFSEDTTFNKAITVKGNTTLGDAASDTVVIPGPITNATTLFVTDVANSKVGVLAVPISTDAPFQVAGTIRATNNTGAPTTGEGISIQYVPASHLGYLISYDYTGAAYQGLSVLCSAMTIAPGGIQKMKLDTTGIGFFATAPVAKQTVTGLKGGNAALGSLLAALAAYGLITDSSGV